MVDKHVSFFYIIWDFTILYGTTNIAEYVLCMFSHQIEEFLSFQS